MNERIKELAKEAGFYFYDLHDVDGEDLGETIEADGWNTVEKFAEMIVRECARIIESQDVDPAFKHRMSWSMKKHFGVNE